METEKKSLYKGRFNYQGEIHILWRRACNPIHATHLFYVELGHILKISPYAIIRYFSGQKDNFLITEVKEEDNDNSTRRTQ